jgi:PKD repeat protein
VRNPDGQDSLSQRITVPDSESMAPVANFTAAVSDLQATFTDTSTNKVTSWEWDFGDGSRSAVQHPIHIYKEPGIYSVNLTVGNAAGSSTFSKSIVVPQSQAPGAEFQYREVEDLKVLFLDASSNDPTTWEWDFGDGGKSRDRNPSHIYSAPGTYTVTLTAANLAGRSTAAKFVTVFGPLTANFSAQVNGKIAVFIDLSSGEPTSFEWVFGDNTPKANDRNPVHEYAGPGTYAVTLTVTRMISGSSTPQQAVVTKDIVVQ